MPFYPTLQTNNNIRIFRHTESDKEGSATGRTLVQAAESESNTPSRKRGRPPGTKNQCSKPKAIRGVKARRMEQSTVGEQRTQVSRVDDNTHICTNNNNTNTTNNDNTTIPECNNHCNISTLNDSTELQRLT